jgi:pyroglutamyl-peptidase
MTVLITGFGPYDGGSNASGALVEVLSTDLERLSLLAGGAVFTTVLPVDTEQAPILLDHAIAHHRPTRLLLTGQAPGRNRIGLESRARNIRHFSVPDAAGRMIEGLPVVDGGAEALTSTWRDLAALADILNAAGIPAEVSMDCGSHLCNQLLYGALHAHAAHGLQAAMFLHLPLLPEQVIRGEPAARRHQHCPYLPLSFAVKATELILRSSAPEEVE